jgi:hypothetical protein
MPAFDRFARPLKNTAALAIIAGSMVWVSFSIYGLVMRVDESRAAVLPISSDGAIRSPEPAARKESSTPQPAEPSAKAIPSPSVKQDEGVPPLPKPHTFRDDYHNRICADGWDADKELRIGADVKVTVKLAPGCFGPRVFIPKDWNWWNFQLDAGGKWIAYIFPDSWLGAIGPFDPDGFLAKQSSQWQWQESVRFQGDGSVTVYKMR